MSLHHHGNIVETTYWYPGNAVISNTYRVPVKTQSAVDTCAHNKFMSGSSIPN